ncbi:olfactory receptor 8U3-like [Pelobates fuscus]|uniref:olfactory receptor 8U3-like n=1 Tax=Pelobates fuscus TaxID=191477 RepID=UPI002FE498D2
MENISLISINVFLVGIQEMETFKYLYFVIILGIYISNMLFCSLLMCIIRTEPSLHEPMYIFIFNLISNGMFGSTAFLPKLMIDLLSGSKTISIHSCLVQAFCIQCSACTEILTFTVMAYDRYLAVCYPLRYPTLMTNGKALRCAAVTWIVSFTYEAVVVILTARLTLCGTNINNVYCETLSLLKLSCGDTTVNNIFGTVTTLFLIIVSEMIVIYCYIQTFTVCLKISKDECQKAIHTLVTHLIAFSLFMGAVIFISFRHRLNIGALSNNLHLVLGVVGLTISITINPIIYGIRTVALRSKMINFLNLKNIYVKDQAH